MDEAIPIAPLRSVGPDRPLIRQGRSSCPGKATLPQTIQSAGGCFQNQLASVGSMVPEHQRQIHQMVARSHRQPYIHAHLWRVRVVAGDE